MAGVREGAHHGPAETRLSELGAKLPRTPSPRFASLAASRRTCPCGCLSGPEAALGIRPAIEGRLARRCPTTEGLSRANTSSRWCQKWTRARPRICRGKIVSFAHQKIRTTNILKYLLADWDAKIETVRSGASADLPEVPQAEKEGGGQGVLVPQIAHLRLLTTGKVVLRRQRVSSQN